MGMREYRSRKVLMGVAALLMLAASLALSTSAGATTGQCPSGGSKTESQVDGDLDGIVLPAGTQFCVKGSTDVTGVLTADGSATLFEYLSDGRNVSNYVVYRRTAPTERPTPTEP